jgi:hypothetical protein
MTGAPCPLLQPGGLVAVGGGCLEQRRPDTNMLHRARRGSAFRAVRYGFSSLWRLDDGQGPAANEIAAGQGQTTWDPDQAAAGPAKDPVLLFRPAGGRRIWAPGHG